MLLSEEETHVCFYTLLWSLIIPYQSRHRHFNEQYSKQQLEQLVCDMCFHLPIYNNKNQVKCLYSPTVIDLAWTKVKGILGWMREHGKEFFHLSNTIDLLVIYIEDDIWKGIAHECDFKTRYKIWFCAYGSGNGMVMIFFKTNRSSAKQKY